MEQYIVPLVHNTVELVIVDYADVFRLVERILKLSIPNLYVWLLGFYWFFHIYLNILAEVLRFGDRQFYMDWWDESLMFLTSEGGIQQH